MQCVVCHDAGGAEVLASYVSRQGGEWIFVLEGPARKVFERRFGPVAGMSLDDAMAAGSQFLTGSSWQSDLEWCAIAAARRAGKPVATFLDHWVNYRERFIREGVECLPDSIWVGDDYALERARAVFPEIEIRLVANPYFQDVREELARYTHDVLPVSNGLRVLFVCEPISEHAEKAFGDPRYWGYTEFDALHYFFSHLELLGRPVHAVVIRPHPSERAGKYDTIAQELASSKGIPLRVGGEGSLLQEIAACDVVAGCESMAMVVGLIAGRRVVSAIPPGGRACSLPHQQIETLHEPAGSGVQTTPTTTWANK